MGNVARHTFAYRGACGKRITIVVRRRLELRMQRGSFGFPIFPPVADKGKSGIQIAPGGPIGEWSNIAMLFLKAITNAKKTYIYKRLISCLPKVW